jgi:hypothetical protein
MMVLPLLLALGLGLHVQADTVFILASAERDLTGDGATEVLRLVAAGQSIDSLEVTFVIEASGRTVLRTRLSPVTRAVGFDADRRVLSPAQHRARLDDFGAWFFHEDHFMQPAEFIEELRRQAPGRVQLIPEVLGRDRRRQLVIDSLTQAGLEPADAERRAPALVGGHATRYDTAWAARTWAEIQGSGVVVFRFSPGGDSVTAIAWSSRDGRFYRLLECC